MIRYPAIFHKEKKGFWVEFPDIPGCVTEGKNFDHALLMAKEALSGILEVRLEYDEPIRKPAARKGKNVFWVEPELHIGVAVTLRWIRKKKGRTMKEIAQRMGVSIGEYQRLEDPKRSNPTLKKLEHVCRALDIRVQDLFRT